MSETDIAIVGMAAHLPGARSTAEFWAALHDGHESVRELSEEELLEAGVSREVMRRPGYVRSASMLDDVFHFDPEFFGFSPKEAGIMDPQHRHFLMAAWEALEDAGHPPSTFDGAIGVFAGCGQNSYFVQNLLSNPDLVHEVGPFLLRHTGNDKDFLTTRVSYLFDLRGPSINVQTACSTSLVATHLGVQHLLSGECDMALAGGVTIEIPHGQGYQYAEGEILSPDGHCRAFDRDSKGTVFGSGTGVVVLRRLADALDDGDQIYAVIKGTAVNNDGTQKVGYLAPSVDGQAACIAEALAVADVDPATIDYVECHGTGTPMGDPIEVAALAQAFGELPAGSVRIGSVKTNIGHLDTAAGVASLMKVALSLRHGHIPASLNFTEANPALELERGPFAVNDRLHIWDSEDATPLRAAVNSLGVGGTNAFAVLEAAPPRPATAPSDGLRLLTVSGRSRSALDANTARLAAHLRANPDLDLADVAWTLQVGRHHFTERRVLAARDLTDAADALEQLLPTRVFSHSATTGERAPVFMFPGGGVQHVDMAADLYGTEPVFAEHVDTGLRLLEELHDLRLRDLLFPAAEDRDAATAAMEEMVVQLPLVFIVEYALAQLLIDRGIQPRAMVGYSLGENTAACIAGTISFEACLGLVVLRGRLFGRVPGGAIAVPLAADELSDLLDRHGADLAIVNGPELSVISGTDEQLAAIDAELRAEGVESIAIPLRTAVHSRLLDPVLDDFREYLRSIQLRAPSIPWVSNRTGTWITSEQATDPDYWVDHLRHTILFADCITTLADDPNLTLLEVGPRRSLSSIVRGHPEVKPGQVAIPTMRHPEEDVPDDVYLLAAIGRLWAVGGTLGTEQQFTDEVRRRVPLPTYAFQTQPFKIEPGSVGPEARTQTTFIDRTDDEDRWFWRETWRSQDLDEPIDETSTWLVLVDQSTVADEIVERLRRRGDDVVIARCGDSFHAVSEHEYVIAPELGLPTYESLIRDLVRTGRIPDRIAHLALLATDDTRFRPGSSFFHRNQELGFQSLVLLAQAWAGAGVQRPLHIVVATAGSQRALPTDRPRWPEQSTVLGPALVIPREFADVSVSTVDVDPVDLSSTVRFGDRLVAARAAFGSRTGRDGRQPTSEPSRVARLADQLVGELLAPAANERIALRGERRLIHDVRRTPAPNPPGERRLRRHAAVLVTGGLGGIGLTVAEELVDAVGARVALLSRTSLPDREEWDELLVRLGPEHPTALRIRRIRSLEARGANVLLLTGDVTDVTDVERVTRTVRERFGTLDAIVHAAGTVADELIAVKSQADMEDVLAPKVYGTLVLEEATRHDELDLFVVFASTSTISAPVGQADYVAANAFLNAWAAARRAQGERHVLALDWGVWQEVGMAAEAAADDPAPSTEPIEQRTSDHPFFDRIAVGRDGIVRLTSTWSADAEWFLDDHRTGNGTSLLPGTGYPELARGALAELGIDRPFEIRGLTFLRPLVVPDVEPRVVETVLQPTEMGYALSVREQVQLAETSTEGAPLDGPTGWRRVAEAEVLLYRQDDVPRVDLAAMAAACPARGASRTAQQDHLRFGPRWDVVERVQRGADEAIAWLRLPDEVAGDLESVPLHPGLLDLATGFAMDLVEGYTGDALWVPVDYRRIRVLGPLSREVISLARARSTSSEESGFATFDVTICAPDGEVLVLVTGFTMKRLEGAFEVGSSRVLASELEADDRRTRPTSRSELVFQHNLSQGIRPAEGARAFRRAIATDDDVVYVTSMDLHELRDQSDAAAAAQLGATGESSAVFGRPDLDSDYVAARDDVEETLVTMWQELLGIDKIGIFDSFFDLGGHSLIAVRLFARVKRTFGVEFPISVLFEAPTIADCADLVRAALPDTGDGAAIADQEDRSTIAPTPPRFRHLVAMHPGEGGPRTPFFLVAGMFGNVLNLRHLAHLIGTDRPFYGVQARGIYGEEPPHEDFLDMAAAYVAEVQQVQPRGPYLLGGFSGGGITALEMARLLGEKGEEVALLVMLDTPIHEVIPLTLADKLALHSAQLRQEGAGYVTRWARSRVAWEREVRQRARGDEQVPADDGALHSQVVMEAFYRALDRYEMRYYGGRIHMFRPPQNPLHVFGPDRQIDINRRFIYADNGWGPWCDEVLVTEVPGNHDSMVLEPNVRVLAGHIRAEIERIDSTAPVQPGLPPAQP